jgi:hypothetical protein
MAATIDRVNTLLVLTQARQRKSLRALVMSQLYSNSTSGSSLTYGQTRDPLTTLANTFSRYAQTQQTAYETGASCTSATGGNNLMERQVSQAIAQVLGRAPGRNPDSFVSALRDAFPSNSNGKITFTPARSTVSLYSQNGSQNGSQIGNYTANSSIAAGLMGQLSSEQATLYRQASIIATDALKVLDGLRPFIPDAELDRVEALRMLVRTELKSLLDEFGRIDEPRAQRVETYFNQMIGANGHLFQFGDRAFLDRRSGAPATIDDEAQIAGYELLKNYASILRNIWDNYNKPAKSTAFPLFSERLSRASVLLPVIAEGNSNFMSALDSIGFTENERRSSASKFTTLGTGLPELPDITVNDLNEWIDRFASMEAPSVLADSGQYGLQFVTEQADSIFWTIVPILAFTKTAVTLRLSSNPIVAQALEHERVTWALDDLVNQLNALADLSA